MNVETRTWDTVRNNMLSSIPIRLKEVFEGSEKVISLLQKNKNLPIPTLSHWRMFYYITNGLGLLSLEVINSNKFYLCLYNHNFSESLFEKEIININEVSPELEKLLIEAPSLVKSYIIEKRKKYPRYPAGMRALQSKEK